MDGFVFLYFYTCTLSISSSWQDAKCRIIFCVIFISVSFHLIFYSLALGIILHFFSQIFVTPQNVP